jgi:hypothetical protein
LEQLFLEGTVQAASVAWEFLEVIKAIKAQQAYRPLLQHSHLFMAATECTNLPSLPMQSHCPIPSQQDMWLMPEMLALM